MVTLTPKIFLLTRKRDDQMPTNGILFKLNVADGGQPIKLAHRPVKFNHEAVQADAWRITMKAGTKLKSAVCDTEVMVIKSRDVVVECGGQPMVDEAPATKLEVNPDFAEGTKVGKRYINADGTIELLCVKAGAGSLAIGGEMLTTKDAKPLPSSD